jgi:hypothetical protein
MGLLDRFKGAWTAFKDNDELIRTDVGVDVASRSGWNSYRRFRTNSVTTPIFNRMATDVSQIEIRHMRKDQKTGGETQMQTELIDRLTFEANIDQTGRALIQDIVYSLMDEGKVAVVPVTTSTNPTSGSQLGGYDILSLRTARITKFYTHGVEVDLYDERDGTHKNITLQKDSVAIIQNPIYAVVNGPNSTLERLLEKINLLDAQDKDTSGGKLNLIAQLPYPLQVQRDFDRANKEIELMENGLRKSKFGVTAIGSTTKITQVNKDIVPTLQAQIEYLTNQFLDQLGITEAVFNGTASEEQLIQYYARVIDPIMDAILDEFNRKFISKTARTQGQHLVAYRDPFAFSTAQALVQAAKETKEARILDTNELRPKLGYEPRFDDPEASRLSNPNVDVAADDGQARSKDPLTTKPNLETPAQAGS